MSDKEVFKIVVGALTAFILFVALTAWAVWSIDTAWPGEGRHSPCVLLGSSSHCKKVTTEPSDEVAHVDEYACTYLNSVGEPRSVRCVEVPVSVSGVGVQVPAQVPAPIQVPAPSNQIIINNSNQQGR